MELSEADRFLIDQIQQGDADAWRQLVDRYRGRLLAFARSHLHRDADAEDLVQETFVNFLQQRHRFDPSRSLETFLFMILRRRMIDATRGRASRVCFLQDTFGDDRSSSAAPASTDPSASWYVRRDEQAEARKKMLAEALAGLVQRFKQSERFRDLEVAELLFYAQLRNGEIARLLQMDEKAVALLKHRWLKEVAQSVMEHAASGLLASATDDPASLLTEVWEELRLTCPKRSTLGRWVLGSLEEPWRQFVTFHIDTLGCRFCKANLDDLHQQTAQHATEASERIFRSTIGFLKK